MAQEELQKAPNGVSVQGKLRLRNGLHARPAARLAKEAQRYRSTIRLVTDAGHPVACPARRRRIYSFRHGA